MSAPSGCVMRPSAYACLCKGGPGRIGVVSCFRNRIRPLVNQTRRQRHDRSTFHHFLFLSFFLHLTVRWDDIRSIANSWLHCCLLAPHAHGGGHFRIDTILGPNTAGQKSDSLLFKHDYEKGLLRMPTAFIRSDTLERINMRCGTLLILGSLLAAAPHSVIGCGKKEPENGGAWSCRSIGGWLILLSAFTHYDLTAQFPARKVVASSLEGLKSKC